MSKVRLQLHNIYRRIPSPNCRGLCQESCSYLGMSKAEAQILHRASGRAPSVDKNGDCTYLDKSGRCSVYKDRPLICRLFGAAEDLKCPFGCAPEKPLTKQQGDALFAAALEVGGEAVFNHSPEELLAAMEAKLSGAPDK